MGGAGLSALPAPRWPLGTGEGGCRYAELCALGVPCVLKVLPQRWHWKGFSPVWVRRCMLRFAFCVKA